LVFENIKRTSLCEGNDFLITQKRIWIFGKIILLHKIELISNQLMTDLFPKLKKASTKERKTCQMTLNLSYYDLVRHVSS